MNRLTTKSQSDDVYAVDEAQVRREGHGYAGEAVERLARFENFYGDLTAKQGEITKEMEKLRAEGKTKTVKFRQLLANKLTNNNILLMLQAHGVE